MCLREAARIAERKEKMKLIWKYVKPYKWFILAVMLIKLAGTGTELLIPYVLEHLLDHVVPAAETVWPVAAWGCAMLLLTLVTRFLNVTANRMSVRVARNSTFAIRRGSVPHGAESLRTPDGSGGTPLPDLPDDLRYL